MCFVVGTSDSRKCNWSEPDLFGEQVLVRAPARRRIYLSGRAVSKR